MVSDAVTTKILGKRSESSYRAFYRSGVSPETPALGIRKPFDICGISTKKLVLTLRNYGLNNRWHFIYLGRKRCRADVALLLNKRQIILVECKHQGQMSEGIEQLKSYLCGSCSRLGIFANSANADNWTYLEKSSVVMPFLEINRVTFEEQVLIECQTGREIQEKIRVRIG